MKLRTRNSKLETFQTFQMRMNLPNDRQDGHPAP